MPAMLEINPGDRFGKLTALEKRQYDCADGKKRWKWTSRCDCGTLVGPHVPAHLVRKIRSCKKCGYVERGLRARMDGIHNQTTAVYRNYKASAKKRGIEFDLDYANWMPLVQAPCVYCLNTGTSYFNPKTSWGDRWTYTGIDRVDSSKGYVLGNVVSCCKICNRAKSDLPLEDFMAWINRVYYTQTAR